MVEETLAERLDAVERALTDSDRTVADLEDAAALVDRVDELATRIDAVETRLDELEASTQALRGYVGNVQSVNRDVERRAEAALANVEALEAKMSAAGSDQSHHDTGATDESPSRRDRSVDPTRSTADGPRAPARGSNRAEGGRPTGGHDEATGVERRPDRPHAGDMSDDESDDGGLLDGLTDSL
jgi:septal ring factor EnvC (AmiA/AmiB activator)